jgi:hypothetical protein
MKHRLLNRRARCVIVSGMPRSGSSWLAKGLSYAPRFTYYREPDNHHEVAEAQERFGWLYLTPDRNDDAYYRLIARACSGRLATPFTLCDDPGPLLKPLGRWGRRLGGRFPILFLRKHDVLLKLIYASLNLTWLSARFPRARQVCIVRHPCGQFESWQRLGWEPEPARLLGIERLMADHLHPFESLLGGASSYWERAGALWAAMTYVLHRQTIADGRRVIVSYEWLCGEPVARLEQLYRRLELKWSPEAEQFLRSSDREGDTRPYSLKRSSRTQVDVWKQRLTAEQVGDCRRFVEPFGLPYYPDFEPGAAEALPPATRASSAPVPGSHPAGG